VTDWGWESDKPGYDVERGFSLPFVRESNRVRLYGSPASIAAIDDMQQELNLLNRAQRGDGDRTWRTRLSTLHTTNSLSRLERTWGRGMKRDGPKKVPFQEGGGVRLE